MQLDHQLLLASTVQANPGVHAVLLGSGSSRAAGIPTGWEIVSDLTGRLARLNGADAGEDPISWYRQETGSDPEYSRLLELLSPKPAERRRLLHSYFEPTEADLEAGQKIPTEGHRSIAKLVAGRFIRVIITTNFDRLLESALAEVGVVPVVISSEDSAIGAPPLVHNPVTVLKLHGDYLDDRIRNTEGELAGYEPQMTAYLDRILADFGLIVCGWSGEWDPALRAAIERRSNRRYSDFWMSHGVLGPVAERLSRHINARVLPADSFDSSFSTLADRVYALEDVSRVPPLAKQTAVAMMKRYLSTSDRRIQAHDLLRDTTDRAFERASDQRLVSTHRMVATDAEDTRYRVHSFEAAVETLLPLCATVAYWDNGSFAPWIRQALERLMELRGSDSGTVAYIRLRRLRGSFRRCGNRRKAVTPFG